MRERVSRNVDKGWTTYAATIDPGDERGLADKFHSELGPTTSP